MSLLITENEAKERLDRCEIVYRRLGHGSNDAPRPRGELAKHGIPSFIREIIAGEEKAGHKDVDIADSWGVSPTTVRYAGEGRIGAHQKKGEERELEIKASNNSALMENQIISTTTLKLMEAIEGIDRDKVNKEKPVAQTIIARNLASILEKVRPQAHNQTNIQYNVFVPTMKKLEEYGEPIRVVEAQVVRR